MYLRRKNNDISTFPQMLNSAMYSHRFGDIGGQRKLYSPKYKKTFNPPKRHVNPSTEKTDENIYKEFLKTTSIPGLSQYAKQTTKIGKYSWIVFFLIGIALSMFQSWGLIMDYFQYMVYQQSVLIMNATLPFPALTFCNRNSIRWLHAKDTDMGHYINGAYLMAAIQFKDENKFSMPPLFSRYFKDYIMLNKTREYMTIKNFDYDKFFFPTGELFGHCGDEMTEKCDYSYFKRFIHPFYGSCFTYNSGIDKDKPPLNVFPGKDFSVAFFIYRAQEPDFMARNPGMVLFLHQSGTPPILSSPTTIYLYPGEWMKIALNMRHITRLKSPYPSRCVDPDDPHYRNSMLYYSKEFPYHYSTEGCHSSCLQNRTFEKCGCLINKIPYYTHKNFSVCFEIRNSCYKDREPLKLETCDCPLACKELLYHQKISYDNSAVYQPYSQELIHKRFKDFVKFLPGNATEFTIETMKSHICMVQLVFDNSVYEDTSERAKYTIADFWGAVGGNIGFWTGISVLVMMEIFDIVIIKIDKIFSSQSIPKNNERHQQIFRQQLYPGHFINRHAF